MAYPNTTGIQWQFQQQQGLQNTVGTVTTVPSTFTIPSGWTTFQYPRQVHLTDYDIELMALCIANGHPQIEGQPTCFCMKKRLEKGISKD